MPKTILKIAKSWADKQGNINSIKDIICWIEKLNNTIKVSIEKNSLENSEYWFYDKNEQGIINASRSFFEIKGLQKKLHNKIVMEQPIIIQDEIGYLGIICKEIDGKMNFLMQAKIEPGNVNKIQISPTIQATKSNFTQKHGGNKPPYTDYFINSQNYEIVVDQVQSEQSSRFYKKRNRNIILCIEDEIEVLPNYKWMTLGQIKELMKFDNLVNMDTRTVISCIPFATTSFTKKELMEIREVFKNITLFNSVFYKSKDNMIAPIYKYINDYKMFNEYEISIVDLYELSNWTMKNNEFVCNTPQSFKMIFCNIFIEGREVKEWTQPLFEATGMALFGLIVFNDNGTMKFLVKAIPEIGCFDKIELGPTVQLEANSDNVKYDMVTEMFIDRWKQNKGIKNNVILSEEGGRFYHEQNYNAIIEVDKEDLSNLPDGYFYIDFYTLNMLMQVNNCVNIQLRNLLSLLEV